MTLSFDDAFARCPLVAILRGVRPDEVEGIGDELVSAGFTIIEVPMNSPEPLGSIERLARRFDGRAIVGAGTVLRPDHVGDVKAAGGGIRGAPNINTQVIGGAVAAGLAWLPGISTPTEAFAALDAGATARKLFPAESSAPGVLKAMRAVLPPATRVLPVGGVAPDTMAPWLQAGAAGFGLGSALYVAGRSAADVDERARQFVAALATAR